MNSAALEKHIIDTVKEWQMKIGYRREEMNLYYPVVSLAGMLELSEDITEWELKKALEEFAGEVEPRLGKLRISGKGERYCLGVSKEGCAYIHTHVPDSKFLREFLETVTGRTPSLSAVRSCFARAAEEGAEAYKESDREAEGLGHVFYFYRPDQREPEAGQTSETSRIDEYVYCIEADAFGLTYHRFSWSDYQKLLCGSEV